MPANKENPHPIHMPQRFSNDPEPVKLLLDESERLNILGNKWLNATVPNPVATQSAFTNAWALNVAACWLRCKLKGEFQAKKKPASRKA